MAWIESHTTLGRHPKTRRLCRELGISLPQAVGHLHLLWHWVLEFAEDGNLAGFDAGDLADGACWEGDAGEFVAALVRCGFLEDEGGALAVHDWRDYAGRLISDRERKREARRMRVRGQSADSPRTVSGQSALNQPTVNQPTGVNPPVVPPYAATAAQGGTGPATEPPSPSLATATEQPRRPAKSMPTAVPDEFAVTDEMRQLAMRYGIPAAAIDYETEKFLDHFRAKGERKLDWAAAWRNWMRRAAEMTRAVPARASPNGTALARASPDRNEVAKAKVEAFLRIARGEEP